MRRVKKTRVKLYRLGFSIGRSCRKSGLFRLDPPVGKRNRKNLSRKSWASVENGRFRPASPTVQELALVTPLRLERKNKTWK